jgi:hypothetical protein
MLGPTHRLFGAACGGGVAVAAGWPAWQAAAAAALAAVTAAGALSPDLDQRGPWRAADGVLPDEALGAGGPMRHRGLTHWWGLPAVAAAAMQAAPAAWQWAAWALLAGWASHLVGDFVFGKASRGRGPGVPLMPWWGHVGLGLDCGGPAEGATRAVALPLALGWLGLAAAGHGDAPGQLLAWLAAQAT